MTKIYQIKMKLTGPSFVQLMKRKKTNKYQISKATKISYQALYNWETEKAWPKDETAELVGRYLGLISDNDQVVELQQQVKEIKAKLDRLI